MKVYLVREEWDNLEEYDCHQDATIILAVCATREKAKEFLKNYKPEPSFNIEDVTPMVTERVIEESDDEKMPQREVYIQIDNYHQDELIYYIDEMEVLE